MISAYNTLETPKNIYNNDLGGIAGIDGLDGVTGRSKKKRTKSAAAAILIKYKQLKLAFETALAVSKGTTTLEELQTKLAEALSNYQKTQSSYKKAVEIATTKQKRTRISFSILNVGLIRPRNAVKVALAKHTQLKLAFETALAVSKGTITLEYLQAKLAKTLANYQYAFGKYQKAKKSSAKKMKTIKSVALGITVVAGGALVGSKLLASTGVKSASVSTGVAATRTTQAVRLGVASSRVSTVARIGVATSGISAVARGGLITTKIGATTKVGVALSSTPMLSNLTTTGTKALKTIGTAQTMYGAYTGMTQADVLEEDYFDEGFAPGDPLTIPSLERTKPSGILNTKTLTVLGSLILLGISMKTA